MVRKLLHLILYITLISSAFATGFKNTGAGSMGMGGAAVSYNRSPFSMYYNPALISRHKGLDLITAYVGLNYDYSVVKNAIDDFKKLGDLMDQSFATPADLTEAENIINRIKKDINEASYLVRLEPDAGVAVRFNNFGIYGSTSNFASIDATLGGVILSGDEIESDPTDPTVISANANVIGEVGIVYARPLNLSRAFLFDLGITLKTVGGIGKSITRDVTNFEDFAKDDLKINKFEFKNIKVTSDIGMIIANPRNTLGFGISVKNITSPVIKRDVNDANSVDIKLKPIVRVGSFYKITKNLIVSGDIDATRNKVVDGYKTQNVSAGLKYNLLNRRRINFPFRIGYYNNLAESSAKGVFTVGTGIRVGVLSLDISAGGTNFDMNKAGEKFANVELGLFW